MRLRHVQAWGPRERPPMEPTGRRPGRKAVEIEPVSLTVALIAAAIAREHYRLAQIARRAAAPKPPKPTPGPFVEYVGGPPKRRRRALPESIGPKPVPLAQRARPHREDRFNRRLLRDATPLTVLCALALARDALVGVRRVKATRWCIEPVPPGLERYLNAGVLDMEYERAPLPDEVRMPYEEVIWASEVGVDCGRRVPPHKALDAAQAGGDDDAYVENKRRIREGR